MSVIIDEGDKTKQGNVTCPQCGRTELIESRWGDPPKCPKCNVPYQPKTVHTKFIR